MIAELRRENDVTISNLVEFADVVLKNNIFTFKEKTLKHKPGTAIGIKFPTTHRKLEIVFRTFH